MWASAPRWTSRRPNGGVRKLAVLLLTIVLISIFIDPERPVVPGSWRDIARGQQLTSLARWSLDEAAIGEMPCAARRRSLRQWRSETVRRHLQRPAERRGQLLAESRRPAGGRSWP